MTGRPLSLLLAAALLAGACGDTAPTGPGDGGGDPTGAFTRDHRGDHSETEAEALVPDLFLLRGETRWQGHVRAVPPAGVHARHLEVRGAEERLIAETAVAAGAPVALDFRLPLDYAGPLIARIRYDSGETWSRVVELP